ESNISTRPFWLQTFRSETVALTAAAISPFFWLSPTFSMAFFLMAISLLVMTVFAKHFTAYEQLWFVSIMIIAAIFSLISQKRVRTA
ncbi:MAG: hypothetical protein IK068_05370, partial [Lachnospiraceae bacterium]|nr:hypothetical protein [Lachnospiraceae bacterium]